MLLMQFRAIPKQQPVSRSQLRTLIFGPSPKSSFYNFRTRPQPMFVIWPKYATHAISRDFEAATIFTRAIAHANIPALPRALLL